MGKKRKTPWFSVAVFVLVALVLGACQGSNPAASATSIPTVTAAVRPSPSPTATPSPTAVPATASPEPPSRTPIPASATPSLTPTDTPPATVTSPALPTYSGTNNPPLPTGVPFSTPTPPGEEITGTPGTPLPTAIPTPVPLMQQPGGTVNIMLLGSDTSGEERGWRTDTIIIVSVNPNAPSVSLLSIPRDLYVYIPGSGMNRINTADLAGRRSGYPGGGPGLLKATLEYNLGIRVHYYARVNFDAFIQMVDTLGGVEVVVDCPLHDTFPDPDAEEGQSDIDLEPGVHHLEGKSTLWYARSRWKSNDYDRGRRQQRVLRGVWTRIKSLGIIPRIPDLWDDVTEMVDTDLPLEQVVWLASIGSRLDTNTAIKSRFIDGTVLRPWITPDGAQVQLPVYEQIGPLLAEALAPPDTSRASQGYAKVEVLNGTTWSDWAILAADRLIWEGFEVVNIGQADRLDYQQTVIVDRSASPKGSPVNLLARILGVNRDNIVPETPTAEGPDFQVIVGYDYQTCYKSYWYRVHPPPPAPTFPPTPSAQPNLETPPPEASATPAP